MPITTGRCCHPNLPEFETHQFFSFKMFPVPKASLETVKTKKGDFELLNCDDHRRLVTKKSGKDPKVLRPDIVHQVRIAATICRPSVCGGKLFANHMPMLNSLVASTSYTTTHPLLSAAL